MYGRFLKNLHLFDVRQYHTRNRIINQGKRSFKLQVALFLHLQSYLNPLLYIMMRSGMVVANS